MVLILVFGILGILLRYGLDELLKSNPATFPVSTFTINILGSFLIGIIYIYSQEKNSIPPETSRALMTGLLGGFTTFSAYSLQSIQLMSSGATFKGAFYFIGSPILGVLACVLGILIARAF